MTQRGQASRVMGSYTSSCLRLIGFCPAFLFQGFDEQSDEQEEDNDDDYDAYQNGD